MGEDIGLPSAIICSQNSDSKIRGNEDGRDGGGRLNKAENPERKPKPNTASGKSLSTDGSKRLSPTDPEGGVGKGLKLGKSGIKGDLGRMGQVEKESSSRTPGFNGEGRPAGKARHDNDFL